MATKTIEVHPPEEAARRLAGISVSTLIALLKARGYAYTSLSPNAKPWGRGRNTWGLTDQQIADIATGQARTMPRDNDNSKPEVVMPRTSLPGHDGVDRIRRKRTTTR